MNLSGLMMLVFYLPLPQLRKQKSVKFYLKLHGLKLLVEFVS